MRGDFLKIWKAQRVYVYRLIMQKRKRKGIERLYQQQHTGKQKKQKMNQSPSSNDLLKTTRFKRHSNYYYGFRKSRTRTKCSTPANIYVFFTIWCLLVDLGSQFGAHWILKGPQNPPSWHTIQKSEKMRSEKKEENLGSEFYQESEVSEEQQS